MGRAARRRRERIPAVGPESLAARAPGVGTPARVRSYPSEQKLIEWLLIPLVVAFVPIALYANSVSVPFLLDDQIEVVRSKEITQLEPLLSYLTQARGVLKLSLALNYAWGGLEVRGYHLVNVSIHLINALLVYGFALVTLRLPYFAGRYRRHAPWLALAISLLFAAHPLQTMAVTYIIQRAESLASLFYLLTLLLFIRGATGDGVAVRRLAYGGAVVTSLLAVLTKQVAVTIPVMLLLYQWCFLPRERTGARLQWLVFVFLLGTVALAVALSWQYLVPVERDSRQLLPSIFIPSAGFGVEGVTPWTYLLTQFGVILWYVRLYLLPTQLTFDYGWPLADGFWRPDVVLPLLCLLAAAAIGIAAVHRYRLAFFCIGWFFITLAPSSSFIPLRDAAFEHRMYLPLVGLSWLIVVGAYDAGPWLAARVRLSTRAVLQTLAIAAAIWIGVLGAVTVSRNVVFQDELRLASDSAQKAPNNWRTQYEYGRLLMEQGRKDEAIAAFQESIRLEPMKGPPRLHLAQIYMERGQLDEAEVHLRAATKAGERSIVAAGFRQLGFLYESRRQPRFAILHFEAAARLMPSWSIARKRLAALYERDKNWKGAAREYEAVIKLAKESGDEKNANLLAQRAAYSYFRAGVAEYMLGDKGNAVVLLEASLRHRYTFAPTHHYLALAYADLGDWENAERAIGTAARMSSDDQTVITNVKRIRNRELRELPSDFRAQLKQFGELVE
jgi:tetratricopeptide (TPR) repeat protein